MQIQQTIIPILQKYGIKKASLFGSYVSGGFDESSDIDILIEPPSDMGLEFVDLKHELEDTLQKKVDLVTYQGLDRYLKPYILKSQKSIL
jgi:uncharacterized protein